MFTRTVNRFVRKSMFALGFGYAEKDRLPTYRGMDLVLDEDPARHIQKMSAIRYVNGLEQPCKLDDVSCEYWTRVMGEKD